MKGLLRFAPILEHGSSLPVGDGGDEVGLNDGGEELHRHSLWQVGLLQLSQEVHLLCVFLIMELMFNSPMMSWVIMVLGKRKSVLEKKKKIIEHI